MAVCSPTCGHPEPVEHARQRPPDARPRDPAVEVLRALAREPVERLELLDGQPEEVARGLDHAPLEELRQDRPAGALDVHPAAPDEVAELLATAGRAAGVRAVDADRALVLDDGRAAHRAGRRHRELALGAGPPVDDRADDLGDDVAGLLEHDPVPDPDVLAAELVEVVERGPGHGRAGDLDRGQVGDRREGPRPADVRHDVLEEGLDLFRRELERDGPARRPADHPETGLLVDAIDLDDDAVGLVREVRGAARASAR